MWLLSGDGAFSLLSLLLIVLVYAIVSEPKRKRVQAQRQLDLEAKAREFAKAQPLESSELDALYTAARQRTISACDALYLSVLQSHPLIKFRRFDPLKLTGLHTLRAELGRTRGDSVLELCSRREKLAVDSYRWQLGEDFKAHECELTIREIAAGSHGPEDFWENEEKHRYSTKGTNAEDWEARRAAVHSRDHGMCLRCGCRVSLNECHIHHTVKSRHGGTNELENLATLCRDCHCMMPAHEHMRVLTRYVILAGEVHRRNCLSLPKQTVTVLRSRKNWRTGRWSKRKYKVEVARTCLDGLQMLPFNIALERGHSPCPHCEPHKQFQVALEGWLPSVLR